VTTPVTTSPEETPPTTRETLRLVRYWFGALWADDKPWMIWLLVGSMLNAVLVGAFPYLWQFMVDELRGGADPVRVGELGMWMLGVGVVQALFYIALQGVRSIMNLRIQVRARELVFNHLTRQPDTFYERWQTGDLVTRLTDDAGEKTAWFLCSGVFRTWEASMVVLACLIAMLSIDPVLTAWVVTPLPLLIGVQALLQSVLGRRFQAVQSGISAVNDQITNTFSGIRIVRAAALEDTANAAFDGVAERLRGAEVRRSEVEQGVHLMYGHGWQVAVVCLLLAGGGRVISGDITLGEFVSFEGFVMTLVWPMFDFGMFVSRFVQVGVAFKRLQALMDEPEEADRTGGEAPADGSLALEAATLRVVGPVSAAIQAGEMVAVVGEVGAGKSTLLELLTGSRPPDAGAVTIGGVSPAGADRSALRAAVAYVPQDPVVISGTVRENILLGRDADEARLNRAIRIARLVQDLPQLPNGLDTVVGERGVTLSGGQQQRVAIARALVGDPKVLLLDDATAALDADTETAFWAELEEVLPEVTAVVVTHRLSTLERAGRILVLDGGALVQEGKHAELIEAEGAYQRIYGRYRALARVGG